MRPTLKALAIFATLLLVAGPAMAQSGKVADSYVRINVEPDFQYRSDKDVVIPAQARLVIKGVPQQDNIELKLLTADTRKPIDMPGGQGWMENGVRPYPNIVNMNLGKLEPGLYNMVLVGEAGGYTKDWTIEFDVVKPPVGYYAALEGMSGNEAKFLFEAKDPDQVFNVEVYRDGPGGRTILDRFEGSTAELNIPYIPGEGVKVQVTGPNGWINAENKHTDWITGAVTYPPWIWNPDYTVIKNHEYTSWQESIVPGLLLIGVALAYWWGRRRATT